MPAPCPPILEFGSFFLDLQTDQFNMDFPPQAVSHCLIVCLAEGAVAAAASIAKHL